MSANRHAFGCCLPKEERGIGGLCTGRYQVSNRRRGAYAVAGGEVVDAAGIALEQVPGPDPAGGLGLRLALGMGDAAGRAKARSKKRISVAVVWVVVFGLVFFPA